MRKLLLLVLLWGAAQAQIVPGRFIVQLEGEPALERGEGVKIAGRGQVLHTLAERRTFVRMSQGPVRLAIERTSPRNRVIETLDTVLNGLIVETPGETLESLSRIPGVKRVFPVYATKLHLDRALAIHRVGEAWAQLGGLDFAGLGVKIAVIDTGIDKDHPGFQDPALPMPEGFPRANRPQDLQFTSNKVIVARSYSHLYGTPTDLGPRDRFGHGTAVAMVAAGVQHLSPIGLISGVAPKAWLGNYNVAIDAQGRLLSTDAIIKAFDDAVADGMEIINLSLGTELAPRPQDDLFGDVITAAVRAGVLVAISAGNEGDEPQTIGSPGVSLDAVTAGGYENDRRILPTVRAGAEEYEAVAGDGPQPAQPISVPLRDVAQLDNTGLACSALPENSLRDRIALIFRGQCTFEVKLTNARNAGARAAVVYSSEASPAPVRMATGSANLPAVMISFPDGRKLKTQLQANPDLPGTINFYGKVQTVEPGLYPFGSRGPNPDEGIKPDVIAVASNVFTAAPTQPGAPLGTSYTVIAGTSFASPLVAGALAVVRSFRPGLAPYQYRSLVINSASPVKINGELAPVQATGAGLLNVESALQSTITATPTSLSYYSGGSTIDLTRNLTITNLAPNPDSFQLAIEPIGAGPTPELSAYAINLAPLRSQVIAVRFLGRNLEPGQYQGFIVVRSARTSLAIRIPYWYAVRSDEPAFIRTRAPQTGPTGSAQVIYFRVLDRSGVALGNIGPFVRVLSGGGRVLDVERLDWLYPGLYAAHVVLGSMAGNNVFRIEAGDIAREVVITGTR